MSPENTIRNAKRPEIAACIVFSSEDRKFAKSLCKYLVDFLRQFLEDWSDDRYIVPYEETLAKDTGLDTAYRSVHASYVAIALMSDDFLQNSWCHNATETLIKTKATVIAIHKTDLDVRKMGGKFGLLYDNVRVDWPNNNANGDRKPNGLFRLMYEKCIRITWSPRNGSFAEISLEQVEMIQNLAVNIAAYVKKNEFDNLNSANFRSDENNVPFCETSELQGEGHVLDSRTTIQSDNYGKRYPAVCQRSEQPEVLYSRVLARRNFAAFIAYSHTDSGFIVKKIYTPLIYYLHEYLKDWPEK